ncbi:MAG: MmcQ/YjbR family DNA-binding protein [Caldilineaceae bacterium]
MRELVEVKVYLAGKPGAVEEYPFGPTALVYKVGGKMFALVSEDERPLRVNLKCEPALAIAQREMYDAVLPGYHMNKRHWNTVVLDGSIPADEVRAMMDDSYRLVLKGLGKPARERLRLPEPD